MIQKDIDLSTPREPFVKGFIQSMVYLIQSGFSLKAEQLLAKHIPVANEAFVRVRDVLVSEHLKTVYFPIPKSACTLYITMLALFDPETSDFDPDHEGIHRYRFRKKAFRPNNMSSLSGNDYFKFTIIRDPYKRVVSGYLDKFVKPFFLNKNLDRNLASSLTFSDLVSFLEKTPDSYIDKHWRPQYRFFQNVNLDYIGIFEDMPSTHEFLHQKLNIDIDTQVTPRIYKKARTNYSKTKIELNQDAWLMSPVELAKLPAMPDPDEFLSVELKNRLFKRYKRDFDVYDEACKRSVG